MPAETAAVTRSRTARAVSVVAEPEQASRHRQGEEVVRQKAECDGEGQNREDAAARSSRCAFQQERERDREECVQGVRAELVPAADELPRERGDRPCQDRRPEREEAAREKERQGSPVAPPKSTESQRTASTERPALCADHASEYQAGGVDSVSRTWSSMRPKVGSSMIRAVATSSCQSG